MSAEEFTTRSEVEAAQTDRLPEMARSALLTINPKRTVERKALDDALELSACDVLESGREFAELSDTERKRILRRNFEYCQDRNRRFMALLEAMN